MSGLVSKFSKKSEGDAVASADGGSDSKHDGSASQGVFVSSRPATDDQLTEDDAALEARTGYKSEFSREFKNFSTISFAFSIMGLISSVATTFNSPFTLGGPATTIWAWTLGSIFNLTLGAAIAELVSAYPSSGGLYSASGLLVPKRWRAITAWCTGWLNFTGQIAGIAGTEYGLAQMIFAWAYVISGYVAGTGATYGLYAALLVLHGILNCFPTGWLARFTSGYVIVNLGMTVLTSILVLARTPSAEMLTGRQAFGTVVNGSGWANNGLAFFLGLQSVQFVMTDYDATAHISEEISRAAIAAPVAIFTAVAGTGLFGFLLNTSLIFASAGVESQTVEDWPGGLAFAQIVLNRGGKVAFLVIWPFICSVAFFVVQTALQANARSFYAFSRDGGLPDRKFFARVSKTTKTTVNAVWLVVALCALLGLLSFASYTAVLAIFSLAALGMDLSYLIPIISRQFFADHPDVRYVPGPFQIKGIFGRVINWIAIFWTLFECLILCFPTSPDFDATTFNYSWVVMMGILVLALFYYAIHGHRYYSGPREGTMQHGGLNESDVAHPSYDDVKVPAEDPSPK